MECQLIHNSVVSGLRSDYDQRFHEDSPDTLLNWKIIEALFDGDATYYSLGPGSNAYRMRWAEETRELHSLQLFAPSFRGVLLRSIDMYVRPHMKKVRRLVARMDSND